MFRSVTAGNKSSMLTHEERNTLRSSHSSESSDNEICSEAQQTSASSGHSLAQSDSINADPFRPRTKFWTVVSSLRRDNWSTQHSRTPHQCQSKFDFKHRSDVVVQHDDDDDRETDSLLQGSSQQTVARETPSRSWQRSLCIVADTEVPTVSSSSGSSGEDLASSVDSHCHSNIKKGGFDKKARTRLILASVLCLIFMTGEMVGGLLAHSLAIVSDAAHLLTDFASFMISLLALYLAHRPATKKLSFGWYRIEILGAFVSVLMLWVLTGILVYSAVLRVMEDNYEIDASVMLITAGTGVAFNIVLGTTLHQHSHSHGGHGHSHGSHGHSHSDSKKKLKTENSKTGEETQAFSTSSGVHSYGSLCDVEVGHDRERSVLETPSSASDHGHSHSRVNKPSNINVKAAFIHVLGDLFQSVGVLAAAFIIYYKPEWKIADPICTFLFSLFVLITTLTIMRDILVVLMEGTPRGINFAEVRDTFFEVEGVLDIHNLRVWSLTMDKIALSVHLAIDKGSDPHRVLKLASMAIQHKFNISETTMQIEEYVTDMIDCQDCQGPKL